MNAPQDGKNKPSLSYAELTDVIDLSLWTGQLLLQHGADSARIEKTVHHIGTALGADWLDILVSPNVLIVTVTSGDQFRTKLRRVVRLGINMHIIAEVTELSYQVEYGRLDRVHLRGELNRIITMPHNYNRWITLLTVGLACGAFSRLFGGDWAVFAFTVLAASTAMFTRQELSHRYFNPFMIVVLTAGVAGVISGLATVFAVSDQPQIALAASVLLLVPGVPLINAAEDFIQGHIVIGLARGLTGLVIALSIALGLLFAIGLLGIPGL